MKQLLAFLVELLLSTMLLSPALWSNFSFDWVCKALKTGLFLRLNCCRDLCLKGVFLYNKLNAVFGPAGLRGQILYWRLLWPNNFNASPQIVFSRKCCLSVMVFLVWSLLYTALSSWDQCSSFIVHPAIGCLTSIPSRWFLSLFWQKDVMWIFSGQGSKKGVLENHWPRTGHWPLKTNYQSTHSFFTDPPAGLPPLHHPPTLQYVFNWPTNPSTGSTPTHQVLTH